MNGRRHSLPGAQQGLALLVMTLVLLVAMAVMTGMVARVTVNNQRMAANVSHADNAFYAADAAVDNVLSYLNHNRAYVASTASNGWLHASSSPRWLPCASTDVFVPCGDGSSNHYGADWLYYGEVPYLQQAVADHGSPVFLLSSNITDAPSNEPWLGCLNLSLAPALPLADALRVSVVNFFLNLISPGLGLPADLCLPLNFNGGGGPLLPSSANPTVRVVTTSSNTADVRGGSAEIQQDLQTASLFLNDPMAPLMVHGTPHLNGDIRIWGNPRPPSRPPYDWSILDLNDIAGLNVTSLLGSYLNGGHAVTLAPLLNLTLAEVLALDWNLTFPLSIWSDETAQLKPAEIIGPDILTSSPRTCAPQFDNVGSSTCLIQSISISLPPSSISLGVPLVDEGLHLKLPDIQDEHNLLSTAANLLDTSAPVDFPDDLIQHLFGIPTDNAMRLKQDAIELADCSGLETRPGGLYWVNGDCDINGVVGSSDEPLIVIVDEDVSISGGSEFWGVLYQMGPDNRRFNGDNNGVRPTLHGALLSGSTTHYKDRFNLVYDRDVIRRAGYRAGLFVRLPGGWNDAITGP